jgi:hypothetical protein
MWRLPPIDSRLGTIYPAEGRVNGQASSASLPPFDAALKLAARIAHGVDMV